VDGGVVNVRLSGMRPFVNTDSGRDELPVDKHDCDLPAADEVGSAIGMSALVNVLMGMDGPLRVGEINLMSPKPTFGHPRKPTVPER
jgi:hypothetical protein